MITRLNHRGPDDRHCIAGDGFTLGAARLSIQDIEHGRQPLSNETGQVFSVQNGEIYNYPALRESLLQSGHRLVTRCDTETLPHLYEDHGAEFPRQLDGMFALAIWDADRRIGLLARDRPGKKPLYLHREPDGTLWFASEIKALLEIPGFRREIDPVALHHFLSYKHVPHPHSIFRGITALPPASVLRWQGSAPPAVRRYWSLDWAPPAAAETPGPEEAAGRLLDLLRAGVRKRLLSDVPVGFFLSGGVDSSLAVALAAEVAPGPIQTFTLNYTADASHPGKQADAHWARQVARRFGTRHHEETIGFENFPSDLRRILTHFDEPFAGVNSTYFLSRFIARHVKVAVSGDGADELFGSYRSHRLAAALGEPAEGRPHPEFDHDTLARLTGEPAWRWRAELLTFSEAEKAALYHADFRAAVGSARTDEHLRDAAFADPTARDPLNLMLEAEFRGMLPDQVLAFVDRLSMAHSLEIRAPFLDTAVMEFAAGLPAAQKIRRGETKWLLKRAARSYFPEEMLARPKEGFQLPVSHWLRGGLADYARDVLAPARLRRAGLCDPAGVAALIERWFAAPPGDYRLANQVYSLLVLHEWHDLYLG